MTLSYKNSLIIGLCLVLYYLPVSAVAGVNKTLLTKAFKKNNIIIDVYFDEAKTNDTLWLVINNPIFPNPLKKPIKIVAAREVNKHFHFTIPVTNSCGYWSLFKNRTFSSTGSETNKMSLMPKFFWEKGDNIKIHLSNTESAPGISPKSTYSFDGRGSSKYTARSLAELAFDTTIVKKGEDFDSNFNYRPYDSIKLIKSLAVIEKFKTSISLFSYQVLKTDIIFHYNAVFTRIAEYYSGNIENAPNATKAKFIKAYKNSFCPPQLKGIPARALSESANYIFFLYSKFRYESKLFNNVYDPDLIINNIIDSTSGLVRDKVIMTAIISMQKINQPNELYRRLRTVIKNQLCLTTLNELINTSPGNEFTNFNLPDENGKRVRLSDFRGKVVLIDFWFNGCGYCGVFYRNTLSQIENDYRNNDNLVFISICGDMSKKRWFDGIKQGTYTSNQAVNIFTDGKGFKHDVILKNNINGFPFVVLLDKNGIIKNRNSQNLYDYSKLSSAIKELL